MLIPVKYHHKNYPDHIKPEIDEIASHFDVSAISPIRKFSLHTEYSYGKRRFDSEIIARFQTICNANKSGVPMLWHSEQWAIEFAQFLKLLYKENSPTVIEIHPPFSDYTESIDQFLDIYQVFEKIITELYRSASILIENRSGTIYRGGKFLISKGRDLRSLCDKIDERNLKLKIAFDIPQLLTEYGGSQNLSLKSLDSILNRQFAIREKTKSIHLWGKKRSEKGRLVAHAGDLNTYFEDSDKKQLFLEWLAEFLNDDIDRYFVPEVNSKEDDLWSIVSDLERVGIQFLVNK